MSFTKGAVGIVAGIALFAFSLVMYAATAFVFPTQAAFWLWVMAFGLAILMFSPIWFWVGSPVYRYARRHNA